VGFVYSLTNIGMSSSEDIMEFFISALVWFFPQRIQIMTLSIEIMTLSAVVMIQIGKM